MLTDKLLASLKPAPKPYRVADGTGNSLFVQVSPSGALLFRYRYRFNGKQKMLALGQWPKTRLAEARKGALEAREALDRGIDPSAARVAQRKATKIASLATFEVVAREWQAHAAGGLASATADKHEYFLGHVLPVIGDRPIAELTSLDAVAVVRKAVSRGAFDVAKRVLSLMVRIFSYAIVHGYVDSNPAAGLRLSDLVPARAARHHAAITKPKQLRGLALALDAYGGGIVAKTCAQLSLLLFQRPVEMRTMEWSELDLDAALWNLPADKMKLRVPHTVPLPRQAVSLLATLQKVTGAGRYVFPSQRTGERPLSENTINAVLASIGYGDEQTAHGFRATARTIWAEVLRIDPHVCEAALAHLPPGALGATYARVAYIDQRTEAVQQWADWLDELRLTESA